MLKNLKNRVNRENNNPPTTGEGIQNLFNISTLFFIKLPIINKIMDKIKVEVISKFKEYKTSPTLYILTCTYKNILDNIKNNAYEILFY